MDFNPSDISLDFLRGFTMNFDLRTGQSSDLSMEKRRVSDLSGMFLDEEAEQNLIENGNPLVYEFHSMTPPGSAGVLAFGCSVVYPGRVGDEYFMTKGHFHTILETGEVYFCLSGHGYMLLENPEGDWRALELRPGKAVWVPERYAHRSICVGKDEPLVTFFAFRADAGHDYGTIETNGYRKLLLEVDGKPTIVDNPKWDGA